MPIFLMFLPQVAVQIYTVLDRTMLGAITGDMHEVGIYEQSNKINRAAQTFVTALGVVMLSRVASLSVSKKIDEIRAIISKAFHLVWLLALPMVAGIIAVAPNLVPWFLGDDFLNATQVLQIGSLLILAVGLNNVSGIQYLVATGKQNLFTISVIAGALVNAIGNLLLIPTLGAKGAIIFSVVAEFTILLIQLIMIRKTVRLRDVFGRCWPNFLASALMFIIVFLLGQKLSPSIPHTIIMVAVGAAIYAIVLFTTKDELVFSVLSSIKNKIITPPNKNKGTSK